MTLEEYATVLPSNTTINYELPNNIAGFIKAKSVTESDIAKYTIDIIIGNVVRLKAPRYDLLIKGNITIYDETKLFNSNNILVEDVLQIINDMLRTNVKYSTIHIDIVKRY